MNYSPKLHIWRIQDTYTEGVYPPMKMLIVIILQFIDMSYYLYGSKYAGLKNCPSVTSKGCIADIMKKDKNVQWK